MKNSCTSMPSRRALLISAATLTAAPLLAHAANTRGKAIRIVVPFPAGGGTDVMGRLIALELGRELNATVIVDNVPGATGTLGSAQVARSAPDGFTLLLGISATHSIAPALFKDLKYSPERDFVALARIAHGGNVLVANAKYAADTLPEMLALVKRSGAPLMYGSWGTGSGGHLAVESIRLSTGIPMEHVPYKGVAPLLQDLAGGQIEVAMADVAGALPLLQAGKIKALAVSGRKRSSALPQVPTLVESGVAFDTEIWYTLFAPAKLSPVDVQRLAQASAQVLLQPRVVEKIRSLGMEAEPISREAFEKQWHEDTAVWARLVQVSGVTVN